VTLAEFQISRRDPDGRTDPAAWHLARLKRQRDRKLQAFRSSGYGAGWFENWYAAKNVRKVHVPTQIAYLNDLAFFGEDPALLTTEQTLHRLSALTSRTNSAERYRRVCVTIKGIVKLLRGRDEADRIPLPPHGKPRVVVLSREEIEKLLTACDNPRDRLILEFFIEMGDRHGEHNNLKIKDVAFDQYSPIVWLRGKSAERRRRIYVSKPDLLSYLNSHPHKDDPNAAFWWSSKTNQPIQYEGLHRIVSKVGWRALNRQIYPHMFRHASATADAKRFTDTEMMLRHGWTNAAQVRTYAHLTNRDIDEKDLLLHGLKPTNEAQEPLIETRLCPNCKAENAPVAIYCQSCGNPITQENDQEVKALGKKNEELRGDFTKLAKDFAQLKGRFETEFNKKLTDTANH
jgi:integrase/ribosomal protein L40E